MAALGAMTVNDGAAVARSFAVVDHGNGVYLWRYDNAAPISGQPYIELRKIRDDVNSRKVRYKVVLPVMESIGSQNASGYTAPPKVAYTNTISTDFVLNKRSTGAQINDVYAFHANGLAQAQITDPAKTGLFGY